MAAGKIVTIGGDFKVLVRNHVEYLVAENARVVDVSPFAQSALPVPSGTRGVVLTNGFHIDNDPVIPVPPAREVQAAANNATPAPATPGSNALSTGNVQTTGSQPVAVGVQTANSPPPTDLIGLLNVAGRSVANGVPIEEGSRMLCRNLTSVTGVVISPKAIQMHSLVCGNPIGSVSKSFGNYLATDEISRDGFRVVPPGHQADNMVVTMNVNLARPADAQKMLPGKVVTLSGDFSLITTNRFNFLIADNAKYLHGDPFGR
jgi:hypothetical protein